MRSCSIWVGNSVLTESNKTHKKINERPITSRHYSLNIAKVSSNLILVSTMYFGFPPSQLNYSHHRSLANHHRSLITHLLILATNQCIQCSLAIHLCSSITHLCSLITHLCSLITHLYSLITHRCSLVLNQIRSLVTHHSRLFLLSQLG